MPTPEPKILLIQIRKDAVKETEYQCYLDKIPYPESCFVRLDVFNDPFETAILNEVNAVIIAGSGEYCATQNNLPCQDALIEFTQTIRKKQVPLLGICFGHHIMAMAFGGELVHDKSRKELGTHRIELTSKAVNCPILHDKPEAFFAQFGHKDHVETLPEGAVHLASSIKSTYQIWTFPGEPIYAMQHHPEMSDVDVIERIRFYQSLYVNDNQAFDEIIQNTHPSPLATQVMNDFIDRVALGGATYPQK